ncbi:MAG: carboxylesterase/lipase family protein [Rhodospirillaceae bacterium]
MNTRKRIAGSLYDMPISRRAWLDGTMKLTGAAVVTSALPGIAGCAATMLHNREPVVETASGKVRGTLHEGVYSFKGIPYGTGTSGAGRFQPARAITWAGVRDALDYGPRAPQNERPSSMPHLAWIRDTRPYSEDCLVLNVFTPAIGDAGKRPVMVYIHGGGFATGASSAAGLDGSNLARHGDVVLVSLNHRLNLFGHLYLGGAGSRYADSGNVGMLDVVAALRWVRTNIARFGGDPSNVTIFGQSGGASKVAVLMAMPDARGLFHKAIVQSASSLLTMATPEAAQRNTYYFLRQLGLDETKIDVLHTLPTETLLKAMPAAVKAAGSIDNYRPVVDGRALTAHPFEPTAPRLSADVPMIIGWCETEARFAFSQAPQNLKLDMDQVRARVARFVGIPESEAQKLIQTYRKHRPNDTPGDLFALIHGDHMYRRSVTRAAELKAAEGRAPAYLYLFNWKTPVLDGMLRTPHTICIPFAFGNVDIASGITGNGADRYRVQEQVMGAWVAFARTGNPNHAKLPTWKPYSATERPTMVFDTESRLVNDPAREERLAFASYPRYAMEEVGRR